MDIIRRMLVLLLLLPPLAGFSQPADAEGKFAIAADGNQPSSEIAKLAGVAPFFHLYDANGNVGQLVNVADGSIAVQYTYDPFGNLLVADGPEAG